MERVIANIGVGLGVFLLTLGLSLPAWAGTTFASPQSDPPLGPGESYPESRFGRPPTRVDLGVSSGYASRAVTDMEEGQDSDGEEVRGPSRMPAGSEWGTPDRGERGDRSGSRRIASAGTPEPDTAITASAVARKGVQEIALIAGDLGFFPKTVFVTRDVPVRLFVTGASKNTLCLMMDSFQVRKQIRSQKIEEITFTPGNPGKYRFYCPVNGMEGTMIVKELSQASDP